jgi:hypothetical protein
MSVLGPVAIALSQAGPDCALVISVTVSISEYPSVRVYPIGTVSALKRSHLTSDSATRSSPP